VAAASTGAGRRTTSDALRQQRRPAAANHRGRHCRTEPVLAVYTGTGVLRILSLAGNPSILQLGPHGRRGHSGAPASRELPDPDSPLPPSTGAGAEGDSASCCGTDSGSLAAVTNNLTEYGTRCFSGRSDVVGFDVTRHILRNARPKGLGPGVMV